jgi:hypothetical protein
MEFFMIDACFLLLLNEMFKDDCELSDLEDTATAVRRLRQKIFSLARSRRTACAHYHYQPLLH